MKTFKYFSMMLAMLVCSIGFVSCSSDDDDDDPNNASIYGTWVWVNEKNKDIVTTLVLNANGTGVRTDTKGTISITIPFEFKYKEEDNLITIIPTVSGEDAEEFKGTYEIIVTQTSMSFGGVTFKRS